MKVLASALKHGISAEDAVWCVQHPLLQLLLSEDPPKKLYLGTAPHGLPLEVVTLDIASSTVIIHAMKMRKKYVKYLQQGRKIK